MEPENLVLPELYNFATIRHKARFEQLQKENKNLKKLLRYFYNLPLEVGDYDKNIRWQKKAEQALKGGKA